MTEQLQRSFSAGMKEELAGRIGQADHCRKAELAAILNICGRIEQNRKGRRLHIHAENETVLRKCFTLIKKTYNIEDDAFISEAIVHADTETVTSGSVKLSTGKGGCTDILLEDERLIDDILAIPGLQVEKDLPDPKGPIHDGQTGKRRYRSVLAVPTFSTVRPCCKRAWVRGAYLASGSMSDPHRGYHLEMVFPDQKRACLLQTLLTDLSIQARIVSRKKNYVVYVKEGEQIVDLLAMMEANVALMEMENIRILKEMRNSVNRKVNCETANINKTVSASVRQLEDIRLISDRLGFGRLSESLADTAALRLKYPDATLSELGRMLDPPVGKSGINHRLRKLGSIAEKLRRNEEERI